MTPTDCMPIARWNMVPWQKLKAGDSIGLVAFHHIGIDRVEFRFGRSEHVVVKSPSLNVSSGTVEYWCELPLASGLVVAVIYPIVGEPRVMTFALNPPSDDVLHLKDERIVGKIMPGKHKHLWLEDCTLIGGEHWHGGWFESIYATNCYATGRDEADGSFKEGRFFLECDLVRHCVVEHFASDAFRDCGLIVGGECRHQIAEGRDHSDCVQYFLPIPDAIVYGLKATNGIYQQGIFSRGTGFDHHNIAIVDCKFVLSSYPAQNQWMDRTHHMVISHNTFLGSPFTFKLSDKKASGFAGSTDVLIERNTFQWVQILDEHGRQMDERSLPGVKFDDNMFLNRFPQSYVGKAGRQIGKLLGTRAVLRAVEGAQ